jgi:hypothetical protein
MGVSRLSWLPLTPVAEMASLAMRGEMGRMLENQVLETCSGAHVAEEQHGQLAPAVPRHRHEVLLLDRALLFHQHRAGLLAVHLDGQDLLEESRALARSIGEFHRAGLHASAGEHLALQDHRAADFLGDGPGLVGRGGDTALAHGETALREQRLGLVLVESHPDPRGSDHPAAGAVRRRGDPRS